jgi:hypothetical protein
MYNPSWGVFDLETFMLLHPIEMDCSDGATLEQVFHVIAYDKATGIIETTENIYKPVNVPTEGNN